MKKVLHWLDEYFEITLCVVLMSVMTLTIFIQVIMRYIFSNSLSWSEELARYLFIWLIYLGISYGCKIMKHIKIDAALQIFPKKARPWVMIAGDVIFFAFAIYIMVTGFQLTAMQIQLSKTSPAMQLPLQYVYSAPMAGFALAAVREVQAVLWQMKKIKRGEEPGQRGEEF